MVSELQASNGVLYLIDEVLNMPEGTIDDIIMNPDYSINNFMDFIKEAKLTNIFNRTTGERGKQRDKKTDFTYVNELMF